MPGPSHDDLRRLAVWLSRRREVDEMMAVLTQYGPTANDRVAAHLQALTVMLDAEREAFDRYTAGAPELPQKPLPAMLPDDDDDPPNVHSLFSARLVRRPEKTAEQEPAQRLTHMINAGLRAPENQRPGPAS